MAKQPSPDPLFTLRGDMEAVHSLCFQLSDDSEFIYASTQNGIVHKWNLQSCREECKLEVSTETCLTIKISSNYLLTQIKGGEIKLWSEDYGSWTLKSVINTDSWGFCKFDLFDGKFLVIPESGSKFKICSFDGKIIDTILPAAEEKRGEIMALKCFVLRSIEFIFILYENGVLGLFKSNGNKVIDSKISSDCPMALDFDGDSKVIVGGSSDIILGFELTSDWCLVKWKETVLTNAGVSCISIRPDKKLCAIGCWDSRIRLFSMKSLKLLVVLQNHKETIHDICYAQRKVKAWESNWLLAAAGKDGRVTLWDLY